MHDRSISIVVGAILVALGASAQVVADQATFALDTNAWDGNPNLGAYPPSSGALIDYELFVRLEDIESDGIESQGLVGFVVDILTNTGITQPTLMLSPTREDAPSITIIDDLWTGGMTPVALGGFGMGFLFALGTNGEPGVVDGAGAFISHIWDADSSAAPGITPPALAGIGIGTPGVGTFDSGGNPFPYYGTARGEWYLMRGQINVPDLPGSYVVDVHFSEGSVILLGEDLTVDITNGYLEAIRNDHTIVEQGFSFTVTPEPGTASLLLLAWGVLLCRRPSNRSTSERRIFTLAGVLALTFAAHSLTARADQATFAVENNAWNGNANLGTYPEASGAVIDYELYVTIEDTESDGFDSQGLSAFVVNILTNTGIAQPILDFSPTTVEYSYLTIMDDLWSGGPSPAWIGGFGYDADFTRGLSVGDDIISAGAQGRNVWIADTSDAPGVTPQALAGVGFGTPGVGTTDTGGNPFPYYGSARPEWYLMRGQIHVPNTPGAYTVDLDLGVANVIALDVDLNEQFALGIVEDIENSHSVITQGFDFTVVPGPATASVLLIGAAALSRRRR